MGICACEVETPETISPERCRNCGDEFDANGYCKACGTHITWTPETITHSETTRQKAHRLLDELIEAKRFNIQRASRHANPPRVVPRPTAALKTLLDETLNEAAKEDARNAK